MNMTEMTIKRIELEKEIATLEKEIEAAKGTPSAIQKANNLVIGGLATVGIVTVGTALTGSAFCTTALYNAKKGLEAIKASVTHTTTAAVDAAKEVTDLTVK